LDDSPLLQADNFVVSYIASTSTLTTRDGTPIVPQITKINDGVVYSSCTGSFQVPRDRALSNGVAYFARVSAFNEIGYSLPQVALTSQKPQVVPGAPSAVTISVYSQTELMATFNPPTSDGGDSISKYILEYSVNSDFAGYLTTEFNTLSAGAPFKKVIGGLATGIKVYVRVKAWNRQGASLATVSTPSSLNPYTRSQGPDQVFLYSTSDSMLTVSFRPPIDDGGDRITAYRIEWDTVNTFNGLMLAPHKGFVDRDANQHNSYTIEYLTRGQQYFVRVFARNSAEFGVPSYATPASVAPSYNTPGKPHSISALSGATTGQVVVSWQYPRIPWHGVPCSGTNTVPNDCPTAVGGGLPSSTGGLAITEYEISWNELQDFSGFDTGKITTSSSTLSYTVENLTPGRAYYIRVLARNAQGAGRFCSHTDTNCLVVVNLANAVAKA